MIEDYDYDYEYEEHEDYCRFCRLKKRVRGWRYKVNKFICRITGHESFELVEQWHTEGLKDIIILECPRCGKRKYVWESGEEVTADEGYERYGYLLYRYSLTESKLYDVLPKRPYSHKEE